MSNTRIYQYGILAPLPEHEARVREQMWLAHVYRNDRLRPRQPDARSRDLGLLRSRAASCSQRRLPQD
jgi:hypothetical protein